MVKTTAIFALAAVFLLIYGCISSQPRQSVLPAIGPTKNPGSTMPGSDRDEHGCIGSAGYEWCAEKQKCIRPFEEECSPMVGNDRDSHGCIGSAGYVWCDSLGKCIRPWEENCASFAMPGSDRDPHGCIGSAGYVWCPEKEKCLRTFEEDCPSVTAKSFQAFAKSFCGQENVANIYICGDHVKVVSSLDGGGSSFYKLGQYDGTRCPIVAPDSMSAECRLLMMGNNCVEQEVDCGTLAAPLAITDLSDDPSFVGAQLSWSKPSANAVDYEIYRSDEGGKTTLLLATTGQTAYDDVFDGQGGTYAYYVRARNANGASSPISNIIHVQQLSTANRPSPGQIS